MSYLLRYLALRYWLKHRGAFCLAALGVALGSAVFVAIQIANYSVLASFAVSLDAVTGKANLQIRGGARGLPEEVYARLATHPDRRIKAAAPLLSKTLYSPTLKTSVLVMGVDIFSEADFREWDAASNEGRENENGITTNLLQFLLNPHTAAISGSLAERYHLKTGSIVEVFSGARHERFKVCAVIDTAASGSAFGGDFMLLDIAAAQEAFGALGKLSQIDLIVDDGQVSAVAAELRQWLPPDATVQRPAQRGSEVAGLLAAFQLNLSALSSISLFVGAFLIYNTIAIAVVRRRGEVAILRAVGADQKTLTWLFLTESAIIGLFGSLVGLALGIALARFSLHAVSSTVSALYLEVKARTIVVPPWMWWGAPGGGTLLALASSLPAAREAATTPPRVALLPVTLHHATISKIWKLAALGAVSLLVAWMLCQPTFTHITVFAGFAAAFFTLAGFASITPAVTLLGGRLAQRLTSYFFGIEGVLASSYLQRALYRSSLVIAALMVSLAMTVGLSAMVRSFRDTLGAWVNSSINADLFVAPATGFSGDLGPGLPAEVVRYVTSLPDVRLYDAIRGASAMLRGREIFIAANSLPSLATGDRRTRFVETVGGEEAAKREFLAQRAVLISERFKNLLGYRAGDTLELPTPAGRVKFLIAGVFYDYTPDECTMYMPRPLFQRYWHDNAIDGVALYFKKGVDTETVRQRIASRFGSRYQLTLAPNRQIRTTIFKTFDQTFAVTYALQLIAIIVAAIGIFDTLIALLLERSRELATLRALGASPRQIVKMILVEFGLIGGFGWAIGVVAGACLSWQLTYVINKQFFGWTIFWSLPANVLVQAMLLGIGAALGAGVIPAMAAARHTIATALQTE